MSLWTDDPKPREYTRRRPRRGSQTRPPRPRRRLRATRRAGPPRSVAVWFPRSSCPPRCSAPVSPATTTSRRRPRPRRRLRSSISASDGKADIARAVYAAASPSVASVRTQEGSGTGFLVDSNGTIVTNAHVVGTSKQVQVRFDDKGDYHDAQVLSVDASTDLAAIKIDASDAQGIRPLQLADSDNVQVGDSAIAIGYPLGLDRTATAGIISGLERQIESPNGFSIDKVIQTDAPVNPGNSGGPLLNAKGQVIGVNSQIATAAGGGEGNVGIAFAIPANTVKKVLPDLENGTAPQHAYLGLQTQTAQNGTGAQIAETTSGGPSEKAGLKAGDVVKKVDGQTITSPDDVAQSISDKSPGDKVTVTVDRNGHEQSVDVTLGQRPESVPSQTQQQGQP